MDQNPYFRLETRGWISWFEVDCNLSNDVVEIPWKRKLDPLRAHRRHVSALPTDWAATRLGRLSLRWRSDLGFRRDGRTFSCHSLAARRRRPGRCLWRWLRCRKRHLLDR